jgi:hypothetical protein
MFVEAGRASVPLERIWPLGFVSGQSEMFVMRAHRLLAIFALILFPAMAVAGTAQWRRFIIPSTGASVEIPVNIFSEDTVPLEGGLGRRFVTKDGRSDLTVRSVPNPDNDSPATFLAKKHPPRGVQYKRVTPRFFAVSSVRKGRIWYNRCNRGRAYMNCVLINYPAAEERQWDPMVTRISLSLGN